MAEGLYGAYGASAQASSEYGSSLYDIQDIDYQKEHSAKMAQIKQAERDRITGAITKGISLVSNVVGGFQAKKEREAEIEGLGKSSYESSLSKDISDPVKWDDLSLEKKSAWLPEQTYGETKLWDLFRGKAKLGEGETKLGEAGERLSVLFGGERKYDWQGKEWTSSELSSKAKLERAEERGLPVEGTVSPKTEIEELQDQFKKKTEELDNNEEESTGYQFPEKGEGSAKWFGSAIERFKKRNQIPEFVGDMGEKYNPQLLTMSEEAGWTGKSW